jgi:hypothetical protein
MDRQRSWDPVIILMKNIVSMCRGIKHSFRNFRLATSYYRSKISSSRGESIGYHKFMEERDGSRRRETPCRPGLHELNISES